MALGTILPHSYVHEDERPCSHVPSARCAWLHRLWRHVHPHTPVASRKMFQSCGSDILSVRMRHTHDGGKR